MFIYFLILLYKHFLCRYILKTLCKCREKLVAGLRRIAPGCSIHSTDMTKFYTYFFHASTEPASPKFKSCRLIAFDKTPRFDFQCTNFSVTIAIYFSWTYFFYTKYNNTHINHVGSPPIKNIYILSTLVAMHEAIFFNPLINVKPLCCLYACM